MLVATTVTSGRGVLGALVVGIERVLEGFWTLLDAVASNPHNRFHIDARRLKALTAQMAAKLGHGAAVDEVGDGGPPGDMVRVRCW